MEVLERVLGLEDLLAVLQDLVVVHPLHTSLINDLILAQVYPIGETNSHHAAAESMHLSK